MLNLRILTFVLSALSAPLFANSEKFLKDSRWPTYVNVINYYHRFYPGVYKALELQPLNKISEDKFAQEIKQSTDEWNDFAQKKRGTLADRQKEIQISRNANERLDALLKMNKETVAIKGVIDSIKPEQRVALTPLDQVFWNSVIGLKAKADLSKINSDPNQVREVRIRGDKGTLDYSLSENDKDKYRIRVLEKGNEVLRVKGEVSKVRAPSSVLDKDSELKVFDLKGAFYQKKEDKLPFGPYPPPQDLFQGENGMMHFKGDGHKHFF